MTGIETDLMEILSQYINVGLVKSAELPTVNIKPFGDSGGAYDAVALYELTYGCPNVTKTVKIKHHAFGASTDAISRLLQTKLIEELNRLVS
jgi:hypothetical protein